MEAEGDAQPTGMLARGYDATRTNMTAARATLAATNAAARPISFCRKATIQHEASTLVIASGMTNLS